MRRNHASIISALSLSVGIGSLVGVAIGDVHAGDESSPTVSATEEDQPLTEKARQAIRDEAEKVLTDFPAPDADDPRAVQVHSRRGDAYFFLGQFKQAVSEYRSMVSLNRELDASHWRLGIALFFADEPQAAAQQFEKYHSFDNVDRENGIWRYLSQYKSKGGEHAAKELIRYDKDDREPFPAVYRLFDGTLSAEEALAAIPSDISAEEKEKRLFYTELYIGMHLVVQQGGNPEPDFEAAKRYLGRAVSRKWPRTGGFGPNFMWHVARLQIDLLQNK
ncbi:MAG: hypothetical protein R3C19_20670 [Planctomycetaceae bacterium]